MSTARSRTPERPYCWQSKEALRQIERTYDSGPSTRLVRATYFALAQIASDRQAESFECSVKEIANCMHYRYDQTLKGIQLAEAAGIIKVERRKVPGTAENAPSIYTLLGVIGRIDKVIDYREIVSNPERYRRNNRRNREGTEKELSRLSAVERVVGNNGGTEPTAAESIAGVVSTAGVVTATFKVFWDAYPRKVGKRNAQLAWARAAKRGLPQMSNLIAKLGALKASPQWQKDGGQFIPYPATWLNSDGWNDEVPEAQQPKSPQW